MIPDTAVRFASWEKSTIGRKEKSRVGRNQKHSFLFTDLKTLLSNPTQSRLAVRRLFTHDIAVILSLTFLKILKCLLEF